MNAVSSSKDWFVEWFDSQYYHLLYNNRNEREGRRFLKELLLKLNPTNELRFIDLGCGNGRHSTYLGELGYEVLGIDLSPSNIEMAKTRNNPNVHYKVSDMRSFEVDKEYDVVLNLFTSFGYFSDTADNIKVLTHVAKALTKNGRIVIDYLNLPWVRSSRVTKEVIVRGEVSFNISRFEQDDQIVKVIDFEAEGKSHHYTEYVQALSPQDMFDMLQKSGYIVEQQFGDYEFNPLTDASPRCIIIARKA